MMKKLLAVMAISVLMTASVAFAQTAEKPIVWKAQTLWNASEIPQKTFIDLCENIKVMSGGRLIIEVFPSGAIVPQNETLTALENNVLQVIHVWPGYAAGKNPAFAALCDLIFAYEHPWELDTFMTQRGGLELLRDLYKPFNAYTVGVGYWGVESWPSRKPIRNMEDVQGLKIRISQGMQAEMMAEAGASVVQFPGNEIFSALDKGVVDATDWSTAGVNHSLGLADLAPYFTYPGFHSMPISDFTVNMKEWEKLPADLKAIVETAVRRWCWDTVQTVAIADIEFNSMALKTGKYHPVAWSEEDKAKGRAAARKVWDSWKNKNEDTRKVIEAQEAWLRELGRIE